MPCIWIISACDALKVGVFKSFVGSIMLIHCMILPTGGSSSGTSLTNTLGNIARKSGTACGFVMADIDSLDFPVTANSDLVLGEVTAVLLAIDDRS